VTAAATVPTLATATLDAIVAETEKRKLQLEPNTLDESWWLCERIAQLNLHGVKTPEDALARVMTGRPLGLPAMQSIEQIHLVWNKTSETWTTVMSVKAKLALVYRRKDVVEYIRPVKLTNTEATWVAKRRGEGEIEQSYTFTIGDAETAGLVGRGKDEAAKATNNYNRNPGPMLQWRACGRLCDIIAADVLLGIATAEEVSEDMGVAEQLQAAADEVVARIKPTLDQKLDAKPSPPPPVATVTAPRDWESEAAAIKSQITVALESKDKALQTALRRTWAAFQKEAPEAIVANVSTFYDLARGAKSKDKPAEPSQQTPEPAARQLPACVVCGQPVPGDAGVWVPGKNAWQHIHCVPSAAPKPAFEAGDAYEGPEAADELPFK